MKILFTGGGSGGHFYPIIAIAEEMNRLIKEYKLVESELYFMSDAPYDERALYDNKIKFVKVRTGKIRRYVSLLNFFDLFKTTRGVLSALRQVFKIYPDVVFGKGGYGSFPALFAARLLGIPVIIHESDSEPGRVNLWAGKFAKKIAISYPTSAQYFPKDKVALTGNPIRKGVLRALHSGAREFLELEENAPVIVVLGGSLGAKKINEVLVDALPDLLTKYQIIHQTGRKHFDEMRQTADVVLAESMFKKRYKPFAYLNDLALSMAAGAAMLVVSRAGSQIFEIASWGLPSIIIPISPEVSHDQHKNAFHYARTGACSVIDDNNLTTHVLISEVDRMINDKNLLQKMSSSAKQFSKQDAARKIAEEIMHLALPHER
ncbi:MAG: hypothetical protein A3G52_01970 [Candidatus Taylorbacteria bacterium RIFCSPLOWO2_12_FULL_43_20]|uniref:UDP-N-acetylglucosamine--N-acetylmuramyl-(pentapeptide) pyrophosphoryl-undecaprenol N-acetylglucosamine transferase n=1 Tax=Candidatus Taylorbacteria bacterium RIFCSPLOWO2_12_FULL_43_20 TaxID=1802332 RepID=A0A1G2P3Q5_9BACT|nr:MAG: hypothetical protein A2825_02815 [Candidatus Taylorbacteria bacterium RIFCSPHIGHO2_01_FULL_43_120]OHA23019.1 MAG: hypothetical protein A3B98_01940 [Candidatus Taylorbacteria bacterium RIFCSPHIGHO2_02_FULL_43_55]OHA30135.1 MAG: hypothetical protein A3E92_00975 [Candidatus Taylorbacteria bacterium RIFCSPHIGHO2_12_FULL_42_34]OHA31787.1 MAG: hypothetical protein A3B09_02480 [Candidatus Taylorbacteria bacterium RIFCSPLOWO2_01_FULL_43_83]OHA39606.1 MAG: hypothetical protein A3H58_02415 [Candi